MSASYVNGDENKHEKCSDFLPPTNRSRGERKCQYVVLCTFSVLVLVLLGILVYLMVQQKTDEPIVNGTWSEWDEWSTCSLTCGSGVTTRFRRCDSPAPSSTGKKCTGDSREADSCNLTWCPASSAIYPINQTTVSYIQPSENNQHFVKLSIPIVYMCKSYNQFYISKDGLVSFGIGSDVARYRAQDWSVDCVLPYIDVPFIAPYFFDAQSLYDFFDYTGIVTFQELDAQQIIKSNISEYIRSQVIGISDFNADWVMEISWINVTSKNQVQLGRCRGTYSYPCPSNSFQLVLVTDGAVSYAIINYGKMDMPAERYDQAGFNGGHGLGWTNLLTSSGTLSQLNRQQGSDTVGRYIFRISSGHVFRGGCSMDTQNSSSAICPINETTVGFIMPNEKTQHKVNLSIPIVYMEKSYSQFYISKDGLVSFGSDVARYRAQDWSVDYVLPYIDVPFIAPYFFDAQNLYDFFDYTGNVTFQELDAQQIIKSNISEYIRSQVIGISDFNADWVMEISWINVTSKNKVQSGRCRGTYSNPCPSNSFQLVLVTDGAVSYAIINYSKMDMLEERYDQAGFNGGHGLGWTNLLTSGGTLRQLNKQQGSDTVGRYIFRISSGHVFRGGCSMDTQNSQLSIYPSYAGMYGGKMIDIAGPCFTDTGNIMCRFRTSNRNGQRPPEVRAIYMSPTRVRCEVPRLLFRDRIILSLSLNGQNNYRYSAPLTIVYPYRMPKNEHVETVHVPNSGNDWYGKKPDTLTLRWAARLLSNDLNAIVDIRLIGYKETDGKSEYAPLATLGTNIRASAGEYMFSAQDYQCVQEECFKYEIGLVTVNLQDRYVPNAYKSMSSLAIPLGWWVQNAMASRHGSDWPAVLCTDWYNRDMTSTQWVQELLPCPCSLDQAIADFGRFQPDTGCNLAGTGKAANCYYHKEAVHCVRSVQPVGGAGNQCCYGVTGQLIFAQDTTQGSTPDRSHTWGAAPYGRPGHVPSLSHWVDDVVTYYYCCLWTDGSCDRYMDLRPTRDCKAYTPPVVASVYGQGHVMPLAGPNFGFRIVSPGDYVLLKAGNTSIQGRFAENLFPTEDGRTITSLYSLVGLALQDEGVSDVVELDLRGPQNNNNFRKIDVNVNGALVQFDEQALAWHDFKGVAVVNTDSKRRLQSNFTVILGNGVGLQVVEVAGTLQVDVMVPQDTFGNVTGIFGDLDGTFRVRNESTVDLKQLAKSEVNLFKMFEQNWMVKRKSESLFREFTPTAVTTIRTPDSVPGVGTTTRECGMSLNCRFDYRHTGSLEIAQASKEADIRMALLLSYLQPVRSCGLLDVPRASKNNYNYTLGTTTTITRCRIGSLSGPSTYSCRSTSNETQQWFPEVTSTCKEETEEANIGLIVGVAIGVVVGLAIIIAIVVFLVRRTKSSKTSRTKKRRADDTDSEEEREAMKTAV